MTDVILQIYPSLGDQDEMAAKRPIGRDNDAYQRMLDGLVDLAKSADDLGYWGMAHTEHHLHSEGMEISPSPLMLNVYAGQYTKRLRHGQLGLVLPAHDPIRLAEEIAIADHTLKGRLFVGMARGYQTRWQSILCQRYGVSTAHRQDASADARNRLLFSENFKIMKMAWEQDLLSYDGPTYQIPFPYDGIPNWPPSEAITAKYGVPGEVDENGTVKAVSVVPKPYSTPHPKLFQAFGASEETLRWCGEEDVTPTVLKGPVEDCRKLMEAYVEAAASRGRTRTIGENIGVCRTFYIIEGTKNEDEARAELLRRATKYEELVWRGWYSSFGHFADELKWKSVGETLLDNGILIGGTVDQVKRQVEAFLEELPIDFFVWLLHWGIMPHAETLEQLELFATHIMPEFGIEASLPEPDVPAEPARP